MGDSSIVPGKAKIDSVIIKPSDIEVVIPPVNTEENKRFSKLKKLLERISDLRFKIEQQEKQTEVKVLEEALEATKAKSRQKLSEARTFKSIEEYKADYVEAHEKNVQQSLVSARKKNQFLGGL